MFVRKNSGYTAKFYDQDGRKIPAKRHINPDGTEGGLVAEGYAVPKNVHIDWYVSVLPSAVLKPNMHIIGPGIIEKDSKIILKEDLTV